MSDHCDLPHLDADNAATREAQLLSSATVDEIAATFGVLGDPTRIRILDALSAGQLCVCDIAALAGISESAVSHQLRGKNRLVAAFRQDRAVFHAQKGRPGPTGTG